MATIVQPYNPWREQLAMSFLGPLIMQNIQRNQQAADNRLKARAMAELTGMNQAVTGGDEGLMGTGEAPSSGDPWMNSFWQNDARSGELARFDAGVRAGTPQSAMPAQGGWGDLWRVLANNRQYGSVNPHEMAMLAQPYMAEQAAARQAAEQAAAARERMAAMDAYMTGLQDVSDPMDIMKYLTRGAGQGFVGQNEFGDWVNFLKSRNKDYREMDLGGQKYGLSFDPVTGEVNPVFGGNATMTPYQQESLNLGWGQLGETSRRNRASEALGWANYGAGRDDAMWGRVNQKPYGDFTDANGNYYLVGNDGRAIPVRGPDGQPLQPMPKVGADRGTVTDRARWDAQVGGIDNEISALRREGEIINKAIADMGEATPEQKERLAALDKRIAALNEQRNRIVSSPQQAQPQEQGQGQEFDYNGYAAWRRQLESGGNPNAQNGPALGIDQFMPDTWLAYVKRTNPAWARGKSRAEILDMRRDPAKSAEIARVMDEDSARALNKAGLPVTRENIYACHHFGPTYGVKFAGADMNAPVEGMFPRSFMEANKYLRGKTKAQVIDHWNRRTGGGRRQAPQATPQAPRPQNGVPQGLESLDRQIQGRSDDPPKRGVMQGGRYVEAPTQAQQVTRTVPTQGTNSRLAGRTVTSADIMAIVTNPENGFRGAADYEAVREMYRQQGVRIVD